MIRRSWKWGVSLVFLLMCSLIVQAQRRQSPRPNIPDLRDSSGVFGAKSAWLFHPHYSYQVPSGDMADRFGSNSSLGFGIQFKSRSNWHLGVEANLLFGSTVKENNALDSIIGVSGDLIDANGNLSVVRLFERGFYSQVVLGKVIPLGLNRNSGLRIQLGGGFLQHKIKYLYTEGILPQLDNDYFKGYDRLSNGMMLSQFIGYQQLDPKLRVNFFAGIEVIEAFTENRRSWNFDTMERDEKVRNDILIGFKFGIYVPIYRKQKEEEEFFTQ